MLRLKLSHMKTLEWPCSESEAAFTVEDSENGVDAVRYWFLTASLRVEVVKIG